jgi:hypothetical protein
MHQSEIPDGQATLIDLFAGGGSVCDEVGIRAGAVGTTVKLRMSLGGPQ